MKNVFSLPQAKIFPGIVQGPSPSSAKGFVKELKLPDGLFV
jgi:hypothetical protein